MRRTMASCEPNRSHYALAKLENEFQDFTLITQNIDNYHHLAGSENVVELHGNTWWRKCPQCGNREEDLKLELDVMPPKCECGGIYKPDVVFFGESLPRGALEKAWQAARCDFMLVIGTSAVVEPAASIPFVAHQNKARIIEFNLEPTGHTPMVSLSFFEPASESLGRIIDALDL